MYLGLEMRPGKLVERSVYGAAAHAARRKRWGVDATITVRRRWTALVLGVALVGLAFFRRKQKPVTILQPTAE